MEAFVTDADGPRGAVATPAAELGTSLSNVDVVDGPALLLSFFSLLDPAELCGTERPKGETESTGFPVSSLCLWEWGLRKDLNFLFKAPQKQGAESSHAILKAVSSHSFSLPLPTSTHVLMYVCICM